MTRCRSCRRAPAAYKQILRLLQDPPSVTRKQWEAFDYMAGNLLDNQPEEVGYHRSNIAAAWRFRERVDPLFRKRQ